MVVASAGGHQVGEGDRVPGGSFQELDHEDWRERPVGG